MKYFEYSTDVIKKVSEILGSANQYIRIAIFQLHNEEIFDVLLERLKKDVSVEIFTLPYDSIHPKIRTSVTNKFDELIKLGAKVYFCKWNIGDPSRTTTAIGRWYSFHGKFLLTETIAAALSANLTNNIELDALLVFYDAPEVIAEFNQKFDKLLNMFVKEVNGHNGIIHQMILDSNSPYLEDIFDLPENIPAIHKEHWIRDYPISLCPGDTKLDKNLYICPFDIRSRDIYKKLIDEANEYLYLSTESFTDLDINYLLLRTALRNIDIHILTGAASQDFTDRLEIMFRKLLASNQIHIKTTREELHGKLIITDKHVAVTSINLNKINLGFGRVKSLWRQNTETIAVSNNPIILSSAREQYCSVFDRSFDVRITLAEKVKTQIGELFKASFGYKIKPEGKTILSKFLLLREIEANSTLLKVGKYSIQLAKKYGCTTVTKNHVLMAILLFYLSENKYEFDRLNERLVIFDPNIQLGSLLTELQSLKLITVEDKYYKLNIATLVKYDM